jgi:hypothetical protein
MGMFAINIPKASGSNNSGSNLLAMAKYIKKRESATIIT